jgi:uncharacterized protein YjbI with pentapeptide repeats
MARIKINASLIIQQWQEGLPLGSRVEKVHRSPGEMPMTRIVCVTGDVIEVAGNLEGAHLTGLNLHRAILERAVLTDTTFERCDARSALFALASADRVRFSACSLVLAEFQAASLCGSRFESGDAANADFSGADLTGAVLRDIRLDGASFRGCNLDAADLSGVRLGGVVLEGAIYTPLTVWPSEFEPMFSGAVLVGDQTELFRFLAEDQN